MTGKGKVTIKEVIEESKTVLQQIKGETDKEGAVAKLHKQLGILAVKAEMVNDFDTTELVSKIERCREMLKQGALDDADKVIVFVEVLCEIQNYNWNDLSDDEWERELAEEDKRIALEDVQEAYNKYLSVRQSYIEKYDEIPEINDEN